MAAIPVTIVGTMTYTDLSVGGGPIFPGTAPQPPLGIWGGGNVPMPTPPIYLPPQPPLGIWGGAPLPWPMPPIYYPPSPPGYPAHPIYNPPGIWGGANTPMPTPPIYFPPPEPPTENPPTGEGRWAFMNPPGVWVWVPVQPGKPHPPQTPTP